MNTTRVLLTATLVQALSVLAASSATPVVKPAAAPKTTTDVGAQCAPKRSSSTTEQEHLIGRYGKLPAVIGLDEPSAEAPLRINLRIYNYAGLPPRALARAQKEASRFFQDVGIELVWMECALSPGDADKFPRCPQQLGPGDLIVRLIARCPSKRKGFRDTVFGYAAGFQASIVYNRIEENKEVSESQILGLLIAHEIGHLVLGSKSHSPTGIMRAK